MATLHLTRKGEVDLVAMLKTLCKQYKVRTLACEGGPTLFRSLLEQGLVDQLNLTIAPHMFGGATAPTLTGLNDKFLPASIHCIPTQIPKNGLPAARLSCTALRMSFRLSALVAAKCPTPGRMSLFARRTTLESSVMTASIRR